MRDPTRDSVTPGGSTAPLGAGGASDAGAGRVSDGGARAVTVRRAERRGPFEGLPLASSPRVLAAILAVALIVYAAIAADVVESGRLSSLDDDLSRWVASSMPAVAEWLARVLSWIGGWVGVTATVTVVVVWLARRRELALGALLIVVALGGQLLNSFTKGGYDRPRPTAGSPIDVPSSTSFPSGHAMTGIAVFGLLGLIVARELPPGRRRAVSISAGFALGALIGASRVVLNVHFLTDVLGGAVLGLAWLVVCLLACILVTSRWRRYADAS